MSMALQALFTNLSSGISNVTSEITNDYLRRVYFNPKIAFRVVDITFIMIGVKMITASHIKEVFQRAIQERQIMFWKASSSFTGDERSSLNYNSKMFVGGAALAVLGMTHLVYDILCSSSFLDIDEENDDDHSPFDDLIKTKIEKAALCDDDDSPFDDLITAKIEKATLCKEKLLPFQIYIEQCGQSSEKINGCNTAIKEICNSSRDESTISALLQSEEVFLKCNSIATPCKTLSEQVLSMSRFLDGKCDLNSNDVVNSAFNSPIQPSSLLLKLKEEFECENDRQEVETYIKSCSLTPAEIKRCNVHRLTSEEDIPYCSLEKLTRFLSDLRNGNLFLKCNDTLSTSEKFFGVTFEDQSKTIFIPRSLNILPEEKLFGVLAQYIRLNNKIETSNLDLTQKVVTVLRACRKSSPENWTITDLIQKKV